MGYGTPDDITGKDCKILCPFCSAPWSDDNIRTYNLDAADQCESGRFGPETVDIVIACHACSRPMYSKEGFEL
jgi:hypothetical protein